MSLEVRQPSVATMPLAWESEDDIPQLIGNLEKVPPISGLCVYTQNI